MHKNKSTSPSALKVFVRPGSKAELSCRRGAARQKLPAKEPPPQSEAIAHGFKHHPALNLHDRGGKIIPDLHYTNFYVGGAAAWNPQDVARIDQSLAKAMSDTGLNNVLLQYFRGAAITSTFRPSSILPGTPPPTVSQPDVEALLRGLQGAGRLAGFDFGATVFNFLLPRGTVLTIDDGPSQEDRPAAEEPAHTGEVEEKASSLEGLGGFHGSVHVGSTRLYYAVGVFSEGDNGIVAFDQPWKNVVATFYHELVEARTDADVEDNAVAWVNNEVPSEEIGDTPMTLAGANLGKVMKEIPLADGSGTVPVQLMWSNAVSGPEGPIAAPHKLAH